MLAARPNSVSSPFDLGGGRHGRDPVGDEVGLIAQHPMQHDGKLAGQGDCGLAHAGALRDAERPGLQIRSLDGPGQNDVSRLD